MLVCVRNALLLFELLAESTNVHRGRKAKDESAQQQIRDHLEGKWMKEAAKGLWKGVQESVEDDTTA